MVDANGVHPLTTTQPALDQLGLMQQVKAVERHTIAAAITGSRHEALQAFALHPLVDSVSVARELLTGYIDGHPRGRGGARGLSRSATRSGLSLSPLVWCPQWSWATPFSLLCWQRAPARLQCKLARHIGGCAPWGGGIESDVVLA